MMVAITISLIMIIAMVRVFEILGNEVASGRAVIELSGQLRAATSRLERDLEGLTVPARPWHPPAAGQGYLEIGEGAATDYALPAGMTNVLPGTAIQVTTWGDGFDDYLACTTRSSGEPFYGQRVNINNGNTATLESQVAEVVWWTRWVDDGNTFPDPGELTCYRRHLLIRPDLGVVHQFPATAPGDQAALTNLRAQLEEFYNQNDLSVHPELVTNMTGDIVVSMVANSLADLTKRENRFCHRPILMADLTASPPTLSFANPGYPFPMQRTGGGVEPVPSLENVVQFGAQEGEDVILNHLLAFDLRVFDPTAPIFADDPDPARQTEALSPGDPGYASAGGSGIVIGQGAFVDLGYNFKYGATPLGISSVFSGAPIPQSGFNLFPAVYDTWSFHYEHDGVNQDGDALTDEGNNGLDDDSQDGVDDLNERETRPPYMVPLRAVKATFRIIENDTRQVRQTSVVSEFIPE